METHGIIDKRFKMLRSSLLETVENFRNGRDAYGLDSLLIYIGCLEEVLDTCICLEDFSVIEDIPGLLRKLYESVKNEDIIGITNILEYEAYPLTEKWLEGNKDA